MSLPRFGTIRCAVTTALVAAIAACASVPPRSPTPITPQVTLPSPAPENIAPTPQPSLEPIALGTSPWPRLRQRFAMQGCDYRREVQRWAHIYTRNPRAFAAGWRTAMPLLLIVVDQVERRQLPGEFALLPFVESGYQPIVADTQAPAGMWQLTGDTARSAGLKVAGDYDERLDVIASSNAALDLIAGYYRDFADWRLADLAYNSGEFRVKKRLGERDPRALSATELAALPLSPAAHEHLDRLLALACIIDEPARFDVKLPLPDDGDALQLVELQHGMDVRLAARLAGLDIDDVRRWNAAYRANRMPDEGAHHLLLPVPSVARFERGARAIDPALWSDWREQRAGRASPLRSFAAEAGAPLAAIAAANAMREDASVAVATRLLLPGVEAQPETRATSRAKRQAVADNKRYHVVGKGDTLERIAHRYEVPIKDLRRWNPATRSLLHPGDRIRLSVARED